MIDKTNSKLQRQTLWDCVQEQYQIFSTQDRTFRDVPVVDLPPLGFIRSAGTQEYQRPWPMPWNWRKNRFGHISQRRDATAEHDDDDDDDDDNMDIKNVPEKIFVTLKT